MSTKENLPVIIYVWSPDTGSSVGAILKGLFEKKEIGNKEVGHAAIQIGNTYISFHPKNSHSKKPLVNVPKKLATLKEDKKNEGKYVEVHINWLNTKEMLNLWKKMRKENYDLRYMSCSSVCKNLLLKGVYNSNDYKSFGQFGNNDFYQSLAAQYISTSLTKLLSAAGVSVRNKVVATALKQNPDHEPFTTPKDVLLISQVLKFNEDGKFQSPFMKDLDISRKIMNLVDRFTSF